MKPENTQNKYDSLFQTENHIYHSTSSSDNGFYHGYKHLRCSVVEIYLFDQILLKLREKQFQSYENEETQKYMQELEFRLENGLDHLLNLLISLYTSTSTLPIKNAEFFVTEFFSKTERLSFELTLFYLFVSMGQLKTKIHEKLMSSSLECLKKNKSNILLCIQKALKKAERYETTKENKIELVQLFSMHDTFFLPLLFSSTKIVNIYDLEDLINILNQGDCFLQNQELRELAVFRHIFLACLINDIKEYNNQIYNIPLRFVGLCKSFKNRKN